MFPQWLQDELGLTKIAITPSWHTEPLGDLLDERSQTWGSLKAGRICRTCNNEWMSQLESVSIPLLLPLIRGERRVGNLSPQEAQTVAVWAVKTVLTLSAAVQEKRAPVEQYVALFKAPNQVPAGIHVFATQRDGLSAPAHYTIDGTWARSREHLPDDEETTVKHASYKTCLQLGRLLLLVVWWPLGPQWVLAVEEDAYILLAPAFARLILMPSPDPLPQVIQDEAGPELMAQLDTDSGAVAFGLTQSVKVIHCADVPAEVLAKLGISPIV